MAHKRSTRHSTQGHQADKTYTEQKGGSFFYSSKDSKALLAKNDTIF